MGTAARRKAERREINRQPAAQAHRQRNRSNAIPTSTAVGALVTVLAVCAIFIYAVMHSSSTASPGGGKQEAGLTDPNALAPVPSLLSVGQKAPDFALIDTRGHSYNLAAQRGHPVVLEFFAVWCPVCQGEAPVLARLHSAYSSRGVTFWSILANPYGKDYENSGRSDLRLASGFDLAWYADTFHVQWPQMFGRDFGVVNQYGVHGYPGLYIVNKHGTIQFVREGHTPYSTLAGVLDKALAAK